MHATLARLPNYVKTFGLVAGSRMFATAYWPWRPPGAEFSFQSGGRTVRLRNTASDKSTFFQIMVKQEYETKGWPAQHDRLARAYNSLLQAGKTPVIIDAGANIGLAAVWFAERYPKAKIFAVEPDAGNLSILKQNVSGYPGIVALSGAVWDRPAKLRISNPDAGAAAFRMTEGGGDVEAYPIPTIVAKEPNGALFIVKIDIEGGESALFRSNTDWVEATELIVIETHDWLFPAEGTSHNFLRQVANLSVDFVFRGENAFCFRSH